MGCHTDLWQSQWRVTICGKWIANVVNVVNAPDGYCLIYRRTRSPGQWKRHEKRHGVHPGRTEIACCCTVRYSIVDSEVLISASTEPEIEVVSHVRLLPND